MNKIDEIFDLELNRIYEAAKKGPLEIEEVKRLSMLVDSYRKYEVKHTEADADLSGLTVHELINLLERADGITRITQEVSAGGANSEQEGAGRAVGKGRDTAATARSKPARNGKRVPDVK